MVMEHLVNHNDIYRSRGICNYFILIKFQSDRNSCVRILLIRLLILLLLLQLIMKLI